jgi:hypothetical protein
VGLADVVSKCRVAQRRFVWRKRHFANGASYRALVCDQLRYLAFRHAPSLRRPLARSTPVEIR